MGQSQSTPLPSLSTTQQAEQPVEVAAVEDQTQTNAVAPALAPLASLGLRLTYLHQTSCRETYKTFVKSMDKYYDQAEEEKDDDFDDIESDELMLLRLRAERLKSLYLGCLLQQGIFKHEKEDDSENGDLSSLPSAEQLERVAIINSVMDDKSTQMTRDDEDKTLDRCLDCLQRNIREKPVFAQRLAELTQQMESIPTALAVDLFPKYVSMVQQPSTAPNQSPSICKAEKDAYDACLKGDRSMDKTECYVRQRQLQLCARSKFCHTQILSCLEKQQQAAKQSSQDAEKQEQWPASAFSKCVTSDTFVAMCANNNKIA